MPKVALIQMSCAESAVANLDKAVALVEGAADQGAQIVCLPELFQHPYFCAVPKDESAYALTETIPGPTTERLGALAKKLGIILLGGSIYERAEEGGRMVYYNTSPVFDETGVMIAAYRKCHIPHDPGFYEKDYFAEGDALDVIETKYGKIAVMICYDQWFPEFARMAALKGAQMLFYPTAIGYPEGVANTTGDWREKWQIAQRGHSAVNDVFVGAVNRVGYEEVGDSKTNFFGGSFISDYAGKKLDERMEGEGVVMADCDFEHQKIVQHNWNFLPCRRPDLYGPLGGQTTHKLRAV